MKKLLLSTLLLLAFSFAANAQFGKIKVDKAVNAAAKGAKAFTLTDAEIAQYCQEYIDWMDKHNPVCSITDKDAGQKAIAQRLAKITRGLTEINGVKLDIKAYYVVDVNAFALANGSVRVFAGLMDLMTDDQILAVIGHELGHVANKDSKEGFKKALLTSALKDAVGSTGNTASALTDSQLGSLGEALANAQFSQKQESSADDYALSFLKTQGKDPQVMASALGVLAKLESEAGTQDNKKKQLFSTHPGLKDRIAKIEKKK